jgi:hypothetical protein
MLISITSILLRSPLGFFELSNNGRKIYNQLDKTTDCIAKKNTGFWKLHYTMTAWESAEAMKAFAQSGAHAEAMKVSAKLATEIRLFTIETDQIPDWTTAKQLVQTQGRVLIFSPA